MCSGANMVSPMHSPRGSLRDLPEEFKCPLSGDIMTNPVLLVETGVIFQRSAIEDWFARGLDTCPQTKRRLTSSRLAPDAELKRRVLAWLKAKRAALQAEARIAHQQEPAPNPDSQQPHLAGSPGGKDPAQLANLIRQGRLNELIRQASDSGLAEAAAASAIATADATSQPAPNPTAGSTAKGVARLNLNRVSPGPQTGGGGGNGGGYAKAPLRAALKQSPGPGRPISAAVAPAQAAGATPPQSPRADGSSPYVRPLPAALQSPRAPDTDGAFVPKWRHGGKPAKSQQADEQQQQPPAPPAAPPSPADAAAEEQQHHGPPTKTPSFDQWAHRDEDLAALEQSSASHTDAPALAPVLEQHAPAATTASSVDAKGASAAARPVAAMSEPAPLQQSAASIALGEQQPQQRLPTSVVEQPGAAGGMAPGGGSFRIMHADVSAAAAPEAALQHDGRQHAQDGAAASGRAVEQNAVATAQLPIHAAEGAGSKSQQWQPPATPEAEQQFWQQSGAPAPEQWLAQQSQHQPQQGQAQQQAWHPGCAAPAEQPELQQHQGGQAWQQPAQDSQQQNWQQQDRQHAGQQSAAVESATLQPSAHAQAEQHVWHQSAAPAEQPQPQPQPQPHHSGLARQQQVQESQQQNWQEPPPQQQDWQHSGQQPMYQEQHSYQPPYEHHQQQATSWQPPTSQSSAWQDASGAQHTRHSASSGYRQDTHSTTLATLAASRERWGGASKFPEWQPPQGAAPDSYLAVAPMPSQAGRAQQPQAPAAAAAGQQQYGSSTPADTAGTYSSGQQPPLSTLPAAQYHGSGMIIDKFGRREPDYSYYTGR